MAISRIEIKAASREIVKGRASGTFLTIIIPLEHNNGYVFLLADLDTACKIAPKMIALLRESTERLASSLNDQSHLQNRFEQILQSINSDLKENIDAKTCPQESLNMIIGALKHDHFIISATGGLPALFMRKTTQQRFKVFDLQQNIASQSGQTDPDRLFHVVLDGDLQSDDTLLLASRDLHRLVSVEDVHPLLSTLPPASALETIEQYLPINAKLAMILFQVHQEKDVITGFATEVTSDASMNALNTTEQDTEEMLDLEKPHIYQSATKLIKSLKSGNKLERRDASKKLTGKLETTAKSIGISALHLASNTLVSVWSLIKAIFTHGNKRARALDTAKNAWQRTWKSSRKKLKITSVTGKVFLVSGAVFIVVFIATIMVFNMKKTADSENLAFSTAIEAIDAKRDQAAARVIYKDDAAARTLLHNALEQLDELDANGKEDRQNAIDTRRKEIADEIDGVRKVLETEITSTPIVNKLVSTSVIPVVFFQDGGIGSLVDNNITIHSNEANNSPIKLATIYNGNVVAINKDNLFVYIDTTSQTQSQIGINTVENETENAKDIIHYGERLYVFSNDHVYRHQRVEGGEYGPGYSWMKDDVDLSDDTSIAIDGSIWVGGKGTLKHFEKGKEIGANTQSIDPPLKEVKDIWTDTNVPVVFILDPQEHRVVAYGKDNADMIGQFINNAFADAITISIDAKTKIATVVSPTTIHTFSVEGVF